MTERNQDILIYRSPKLRTSTEIPMALRRAAFGLVDRLNEQCDMQTSFQELVAALVLISLEMEPKATDQIIRTYRMAHVADIPEPYQATSNARRLGRPRRIPFSSTP